MLRPLIPCMALAVATGCTHQHQNGHHGGAHHRFDKAEEWVPVFEDPDRDAWQKPDEVVRALGLSPDAKVADIGAGTGYFAVRVARAAPAGKVYAVDVEPDMIRYLGERGQKEGVANVVPVLGAFEDPKIPEAVDLALVVDTYHHIDDRTAYFKKVKAQLRPGGRVVIIDFKKDAPVGPPPEARLLPETIDSELRAVGLTRTQTLEILPYQHFLVYTVAP